MKMNPVGTLSWTLKEKNYSVKKKKKERKKERKDGKSLKGRENRV